MLVFQKELGETKYLHILVSNISTSMYSSLLATQTVEDNAMKPNIDPKKPVPYEAPKLSEVTPSQETVPSWRAHCQDYWQSKVFNADSEDPRLVENNGQENMTTSSETQPGGGKARRWSKTGCGLISEPTICFCGSLCLPCIICVNSQALGESGPVFSLLSCCFPCLPTFRLRQAARKKYDIAGSDEDDKMMSVCCTQLVNCQIAHEIQKHDD